MTAKCILHGHVPQLFDGRGQFEGRKYWICVECGKTWERHVGVNIEDVGAAMADVTKRDREETQAVHDMWLEAGRR